MSSLLDRIDLPSLVGFPCGPQTPVLDACSGGLLPDALWAALGGETRLRDAPGASSRQFEEQITLCHLWVSH